MKNTEQQTETVTIKGTVYSIMQADTPESEDVAGRSNLSAHMRRHNISRMLWIKRPEGRALYCVNEFGAGRYSPIGSSVGNWS